ncbi:MAG TPA: aminotransferase class III-fold pyridoxal phosphate-dependent enzyme [Burkholderiaceae bacterium]|nr:aminotransferase class III-fold pyridoxal phosphate-dependent enzyme [Burkholderiaceae bacterium]
MTHERYASSRTWLARAERVIPGAHHLSGRALTTPERSPMYIQRGRGCRITDVDGHEYIDFVMAFGAFLLGYADPEVDAAALGELEQGPLLSMNRPQHVLFAEALVERFAAADMAVPLKTGSEATTAALRIARRATGRRRVARAGYHGWHDWCLPLDRSVPAGLDAQVLEFDADAPHSLEALLAAHPGEIAAVILAPEMVSRPTREAFLAVQDATHRHGALFVLDEVKTAFRTAPGSVQARLGLEPDLTTVSKGLSNGWPVAAVVGRRDVMSCAAGMHLSATYHGDTAAMAAALATLRIVEERRVAEHVWALGQRLIDGLNAIVRDLDVPATSYGEPFPPMPFLRFDHPRPATNDAMRTAFHEAMLERGVLLHPRHMWFISHAHTGADIDTTLEHAHGAMKVARDRARAA